MKKICALFLCVGMLFAVGACKSSNAVSDEALEKLETAVNTTTKVTSADYTGKMDISVLEETNSLTFRGQFNNKEENNLKMSLHLDVKSGEETMTDFISFFVDGQNYYINMMDVMKQKTSLDGMKDSLGVSEETEKEETTKTPEFSKDDIKDYVTKASYDSNVIELTIDGSKINTSGMSTLMAASGVTDAKVKEMTITMTLDKDIITKATMTCVMSTTVEGTTASVTADMDFALENIDQVDSVTMPDFSTYTESDTNSLLP